MSDSIERTRAEQQVFTRRSLLGAAGLGLGQAALLSLSGPEALARSVRRGPGGGMQVGPHFAPTAKRAI